MIALARTGMQEVRTPRTDTKDSPNQLKSREVQVLAKVRERAVASGEFLRVRGGHPVLSCLRFPCSSSCRHRNLQSGPSVRANQSIFLGPGTLPFVPTPGDRPSR